MNIMENLISFNKKYFFLFNFKSVGNFVYKIFDIIFAFLEKAPESAKKPKTEMKYNFASLLGGAKIIEKNHDCFYDKSVLDDNPDK